MCYMYSLIFHKKERKTTTTSTNAMLSNVPNSLKKRMTRSSLSMSLLSGDSTAKRQTPLPILPQTRYRRPHQMTSRRPWLSALYAACSAIYLCRRTCWCSASTVCPLRRLELPAGGRPAGLQMPWMRKRAPRVADILRWPPRRPVPATAALIAGCRPRALSLCSRASGAVVGDRTEHMEEADQKRLRLPERAVSMLLKARRKKMGWCQCLGGSWIQGTRRWEWIQTGAARDLPQDRTLYFVVVVRVRFYRFILRLLWSQSCFVWGETFSQRSLAWPRERR